MKQKTDLVLTNTSPRACTEVKIIADHEREPTESFAVALVTLHTRTVTLKPQFAFVTILDDDNKGKLAQVKTRAQIPREMWSCNTPSNCFSEVYMWLSRIKIKYYSVVYFERITKFDAL